MSVVRWQIHALAMDTRASENGCYVRDHTYARRIVDQAVVRRQAETSLFEPYQALVNCGMKAYRDCRTGLVAPPRGLGRNIVHVIGDSVECGSFM